MHSTALCIRSLLWGGRVSWQVLWRRQPAGTYLASSRRCMSVCACIKLLLPLPSSLCTAGGGDPPRRGRRAAGAAAAVRVAANTFAANLVWVQSSRCWSGFNRRFSSVAPRPMRRGGQLHTCLSAVAMRHTSCLPGFAGNARALRRPSWWFKVLLWPFFGSHLHPSCPSHQHLQRRGAGGCAAGGCVRRAAPLRQDCGCAPQLQVGAAAALGACCAAGSLRLAVAASLAVQAARVCQCAVVAPAHRKCIL